MFRRLLNASMGAALVGVLILPPYIGARSPDYQAEVKAFIATLTASPPTPLFRLRPSAPRTLARSLVFGFHPMLALLPTDELLDVPSDHPYSVADEDVLRDMPRLTGFLDLGGSFGGSIEIYDHDWLQWILAHWTARQPPPPPEQNEGYVQPIATGVEFAYRAIQDMPRSDDTTEIIRFSCKYVAPVAFSFGDEANEVRGPDASETESPAPTVEILPMPHEESDTTCPYLRQQRIDRHACQIADPEIGRDVLANLECLKQADNLVELAKELAGCGFLTEAMMCCDLAAKKCPGSPCAERAVDTLTELACGSIPPTTDTEESAEPQPDEPTEPPSPDAELGVEPMVFDLMKACHLLMTQGMQHQAAELARQAFALDPQRVQADPLVYKMHLLAESPPTPTGASEESEPPTCPYCPSIGKPIREILPEKKKSKDGPTTFLVPLLPPIDYEVVPALDDVLTESAGSEEASEEITAGDILEGIKTMRYSSFHSPIYVSDDASGLRVFFECSLGDQNYYLRYTRGCLAIWTTTDASKTNP